MLEDPPFDLLCPGRRPTGIAPVLLPATEADEADWDGFAHLLGRAADSPLLPGVNLGPGGIDDLTPSTRAEVLATTGAALGGERFVAGVRAEQGSDGRFDPARLAGAVDAVARQGGVPVLMPSPALAALGPDEWVGLIAWMGDWTERVIVTELPPDRIGGGRAYGLDVFTALLEVPGCIGLVHASARRSDQWDRLRRRDEQRSDFQVFAAQDVVLDQVRFGADHLHDLAAAVPDRFGERDDRWAAEDEDALDLDDQLQALATVVFRTPRADARHGLARVLYLRGWLAHDRVLGTGGRRPSTEDDLLRPLLDRLDA